MIDYFENDWNLPLAVDSYKVSHQFLLPNFLESLENYAESRGGDYQYTAFTGFTPILRMIQGVQITPEKVSEARWLAAKHFGTDSLFDYDTWMYICEKYDGKLPIRILGLKEGTVVDTSCALFKTIPLEPRFADLASYIETILMRIWYPLTIGTNSAFAADAARYYTDKTASSGFDWRFLLHDFGSRGVASREQAQIGGAMHLLSFMGSDNFDGIRFLMKHYDNENWQKRNSADFILKRGFSVPATEHLVMTIEGRENEKNVYKRLLKMFTERSDLQNIILSLVSDTYDIYDVCNFLHDDEELRTYIMNRKANTVIRPDSGDMYEVLTKMLDILGSKFGYFYNDKGYKVLNYNIKILQGDGINLNSYMMLMRLLCDELKWSIENFVFGSGGGLLQKFDRDVTKFAIKCSWAKYSDGTEIDVYKDPITSGGSKTSKKGKLWTFNIDGKDITYNESEMSSLGFKKEDSLFIELFNCGEVTYNPKLEEVVERIEKGFAAKEAYFEKLNPDIYIKQYKNMCEQEEKYISMLINNNVPQIEIDMGYVRQSFFLKEIQRLEQLK